MHHTNRASLAHVTEPSSFLAKTSTSNVKFQSLEPSGIKQVPASAQMTLSSPRNVKLKKDAPWSIHVDGVSGNHGITSGVSGPNKSRMYSCDAHKAKPKSRSVQNTDTITQTELPPFKSSETSQAEQSPLVLCSFPKMERTASTADGATKCSMLNVTRYLQL